jgi:hypothetical protein
VRDVLALVGCAGLSAAVAATIGIVTLCLGHRMPWSLATANAGVWWVGDTMGMMMIAPVAFTLRPRAQLPLRRAPEALALVLLLVVTSAVVFGARLTPDGAIQSQAFLVFPCAIWAALRFGPRGAALAYRFGLLEMRRREVGVILDGQCCAGRTGRARNWLSLAPSRDVAVHRLTHLGAERRAQLRRARRVLVDNGLPA